LARILCTRFVNFYLGAELLNFAVAKMELMVIGDQQTSISIDGTEIFSKDTLKVLGVLFDSHLKWNPYIESVTNKCRSFLFGLRYLRKNLSLKDITKVLKSQVVSYLTYGWQVWFHRIEFKAKLKIKSIYYRIIRVMVRDFEFKLRRQMLL